MSEVSKLSRLLTSVGRKHIKPSNFVFPEEKRYPIHDASHARSALSRVSQHGTPEEKLKVRSAVASKYPGIDIDKTADGGAQHKKLKDMVTGGLADGMPDKSFPKKQIAMGIKAEKEHTKNPNLAKEIAKDHLAEDRNYYTKLNKMEKKAMNSLSEILIKSSESKKNNGVSDVLLGAGSFAAGKAATLPWSIDGILNNNKYTTSFEKKHGILNKVLERLPKDTKLKSDIPFTSPGPNFANKETVRKINNMLRNAGIEEKIDGKYIYSPGESGAYMRSHEIGHARRDSSKKLFSRIGNSGLARGAHKAVPAMALFSLLLDKESKLNNYVAPAIALASAPVLIEEAMASLSADKTVRDVISKYKIKSAGKYMTSGRARLIGALAAYAAPAALAYGSHKIIRGLKYALQDD